MVIGLLIITALPTVTGVAQAYSAQKTQETRERDAERMLKFNIDVLPDDESSSVKKFNGHRLVLKADKVWIGPPEAKNPCSAGYVAESFFIEYPDNERVPVEIGLVSQVADDPPLLNWIYVDKQTMELKYGNKTSSIAHHVGPWDWTEDKTRILFDNFEGFIAVEDPITRKWQVYHDIDDDGLKQYVPEGRPKLQIRLKRNLIPTD